MFVQQKETPMLDNEEVPVPRKGLLGFLDRFVGPGATKAELILQFFLPVCAAISAVIFAAIEVEGWSILQYIFYALLAFDVAGGIITNATSSGKRWYHRTDRSNAQHLSFVLLHFVHLIIMSWLFPSFDLQWIIITGTYLLIASITILMSPLYLQRPVAMIMYAGSVLLIEYVLVSPPGMEWFFPFLYLKVLVSHLIKEKAYRPEDEKIKPIQAERSTRVFR